MRSNDMIQAIKTKSFIYNVKYIQSDKYQFTDELNMTDFMK